MRERNEKKRRKGEKEDDREPGIRALARKEGKEEEGG